MAGTPRPDRPDPASPRIGDCVAEFHVTAPDGPLSSPELLLQALRREVLPVLPQVLESPPLSQADLHVPSLEIDLGHWPDDPDWADLRKVFAHKLRLALLPYLKRDAAEPDRDGIATILAMSPAELRRYLATYPAMAANIARWRDGEDGGTGGGGPALSPALRARLDDLMQAALSPGETTTTRQRLLRQLWQLPPGEHGDPSRLLAALKTNWPQLFRDGRAELASQQDRALLDRMASGHGEDTQPLRDLKAALIRLFSDAGLAPEAANAQAVRLMAALALRIGPATLARSGFRPTPVPPAKRQGQRQNDGADEPSHQPRDARRRRHDGPADDTRGSDSTIPDLSGQELPAKAAEREAKPFPRVAEDRTSGQANDAARSLDLEPGRDRPPASSKQEPIASASVEAPRSAVTLPPRDGIGAEAGRTGDAAAGEDEDRPAFGPQAEGTTRGAEAGREVWADANSPSAPSAHTTHRPEESHSEGHAEAVPHLPAATPRQLLDMPQGRPGDARTVRRDDRPEIGRHAGLTDHDKARGHDIGTGPRSPSAPTARAAHRPDAGLAEEDAETAPDVPASARRRRPDARLGQPGDADDFEGNAPTASEGNPEGSSSQDATGQDDPGGRISPTRIVDGAEHRPGDIWPDGEAGTIPASPTATVEPSQSAVFAPSGQSGDGSSGEDNAPRAIKPDAEPATRETIKGRDAAADAVIPSIIPDQTARRSDGARADMEATARPHSSALLHETEQGDLTDQIPDQAWNAEGVGTHPYDSDGNPTRDIDDGFSARLPDDGPQREPLAERRTSTGPGPLSGSQKVETGTDGASKPVGADGTSPDTEGESDPGIEPDGRAPRDSPYGQSFGSVPATSGESPETTQPTTERQHASRMGGPEAEASLHDGGWPAALSDPPADRSVGKPHPDRPAPVATDISDPPGIADPGRSSQPPQSANTPSAPAQGSAAQDISPDAFVDGQQGATESGSQRAGKVDLADLRKRWGRNPAGVYAVLSDLGPQDLLGLVRRLLPPRAEILRRSIDDLAKAIDAPKPVLLHILRNLLDHVAIDLDAARDAARQALTGPPAEARPDADLHHPAVTARDARSMAIAAMMRLVGVSEPAIRLLSGTGDGSRQDRRQTPDDPVTDRHDPGRSSTPDPTRARANRAAPEPEIQVLPDHVSADAGERIEALLDAGLDPAGQDLRAGLSLILAAWPAGGEDLPAEAETDLRQRRLWKSLLERLLDQADATAPREAPAAMLEAALILIEPDEAARMRALRYVAARLGYGAPTGDAALRQRTRRSIAALLCPATGEGKQAAGANPVAATGTELLVTESAGVILLHPFLRLLFDRLGLLTPEAGLEVTGLPKALAALRALDGRPAQRGLDPLHRLLLGMPDGAPAPRQETLDEAARDLIEGLLRSVIGHWGRLGKTSPDGLRETFLQRPGTLRFDDTGAHLRVTPGPFDMLLDGLPWSLGTVALPWMAVPCHVRWRDRDE